jgi:hypothetical protein
MLHLRCHHTPTSLFKFLALRNYADTVHNGPSNRVAVSSYFLQLKTRKHLIYRSCGFRTTTKKVQVKVYRLVQTSSNRTESKLIFRLVMRTCKSASERNRIEQSSKLCDVVSHDHCIGKDGCSVSIIWRIFVRGLCSKVKKKSVCKIRNISKNAGELSALIYYLVVDI